MAKCAVCHKEYNTAYEAFQCETKCREILDRTERDLLFFRDIRMHKPFVEAFEISAECRYDHDMTTPPPKVEAVIIEPRYNPNIHYREEMITDIIVPGRIRCFQLEEALLALKEAWCDVVQKRLQHVLEQGPSNEVLGHLCEKFNRMLQNIESIDGMFWDTLSEERFVSVRLGPVGFIDAQEMTTADERDVEGRVTG